VVIPHNVMLTAALVVLLCLPCAIVMVARSEGPAMRRAWSRRARMDMPALRRLDRALRDTPRIEPVARPLPSVVRPLPSLEQVEAELRRLNGQRRGGPTRESQRWTAAVDRAYDEWLQLACRYLSVTQHLPVLADLDRDIERLRVEARLTAAGLRIQPGRRPPG
jgi:hypothetical protein